MYNGCPGDTASWYTFAISTQSIKFLYPEFARSNCLQAAPVIPAWFPGLTANKISSIWPLKLSENKTAEMASIRLHMVQTK
jgi:hypothetical protein